MKERRGGGEGRGGGGGGGLSQHLKLRQKCGRATVSKSTGQLIRQGKAGLFI